ncbi:hypothetical protein ACSBR2_031304 [Camellia fascicularis]
MLLPHPGRPLTTNKVVALAKFLERKLREPNGLASIKPELVEPAVKNAKDTVNASGASHSGRIVRHVDSFGDYEVVCICVPSSKDTADAVVKQPKKKLKL